VNNRVGPIIASDEQFCHQVAETFATVGTSDHSWTEKVCAMAAKRDGSLQIGFGLGKYTNRNVMDAYAGVSRGVEQFTVRASRRLFPELDFTAIGPITYEVVEPLEAVRFALAPNDCQPIAFDFTFRAALPCNTEDRTHGRSPDGRRVTAELVRYHQIGTADGWVEADGERHDITSDEWVSTRDHSWGVRYDVGTPPTDLEPSPQMVDGVAFSMIWSPLLFERPDGTRYGVFLHTIKAEGFGRVLQKMVTGGIEHPDGRVEAFVDLELALDFHPVTRRLRGGAVHTRMADGSERPFTFTVPTDTGFHLGAGLYFGWDDHHHGDWRGPLNVEGERIADCTAPEVFQRLHQIRDTFVIVDDPVGGGRGFGNCQPIVTGARPDLGLSGDTSFL
jgi:hypothetical protein